MRPIWLLAVVAISWPLPASSVGLFEEPAQLSAFVRAERERTLGGRVAISDAVDHEASVFYFAFDYPVKSRFFVRLDFPYTTLSNDSGITADLGDIRVRLKARLWSGTQRHLSFLGGLRTGSGSSRYYPYASGSVDFEAGLAYTDTLGAATVWASLAATYPTRLDARLERDGLYGNFASTTGGVVFTLPRQVDVEVGAFGLFFDEGGSRGGAYLAAKWRHSRSLWFDVMLQREFGSSARRPYDDAVGVGATVAY